LKARKGLDWYEQLYRRKTYQFFVSQAVGLSANQNIGYRNQLGGPDVVFPLDPDIYIFVISYK
jgi:hypothetical protein